MRMLFIVPLLAVGAYLQGCSLLEPMQDAAAGETTTTTVVEYRDKIVKVAKPSEDTTVRLIQVLDAAGCDFRGVQITDGTNRKNSSTLTVACK